MCVRALLFYVKGKITLQPDLDGRQRYVKYAATAQKVVRLLQIHQDEISNTELPTGRNRVVRCKSSLRASVNAERNIGELAPRWRR